MVARLFATWRHHRMVHVATDDLGACHRSKQERHHRIRDGIKEWAVWLTTMTLQWPRHGLLFSSQVHQATRERPETWLPCLKKHSWCFVHLERL